MSHEPDNIADLDQAQRNIKLVIAYNGAAYHGWQRQTADMDTVQQRLETALAHVVRHPLSVSGASRTDSGVHAEGQVVSFATTSTTIPLEGLRRAINSRLPQDISVVSAEQVAMDFHASRSAVGKTYRYRIHIGASRPVMQHQLVYHYWRPLDIEPMRAASRRLLGEHDFRGFATRLEVRENTVRTISRCDVTACGDEIHVHVEGNGFLYHMVRNIVGTLMEIGRGHWQPERIDRILASRDRTDAGPTAPAGGLTLVCVHY